MGKIESQAIEPRGGWPKWTAALRRAGKLPEQSNFSQRRRALGLSRPRSQWSNWGCPDEARRSIAADRLAYKALELESFGSTDALNARERIKEFVPRSIRRFVKRTLGLREFDRSKPFHRIPGMVVYDEREELYRICRNELQASGAAVEFGAFLGASTVALKVGLLSNPRIAERRKSGDRSVKFHVYDQFKTPKASPFAELTRAHAAGAGLSGLLREEDGWLDFHRVFLAHLGDPQDLVIVHRGLVSALDWGPEPIEFLHLDLPKDWEQLQHIMGQTFPRLVRGGFVLFQDFVYHWSAELIAGVGFLLGAGILTPERLVATTLVTRVVRSIDGSDLALLKEEMEVPERVSRHIDRAVDSCADLLDWEDRIVLELAKAVYFHQRVSADSAYDALGHAAELLRAAARRDGSSEAVAIALREIFECKMRLPKSWG
jgi:hypothetical protein